MVNPDPRATDPRWRSTRPDNGPVIDMTPDGAFIDRPPPGVPPIPVKIMGVAILIAVLSGAAVVALLALWLALTLIPVLIAAAAVAYGAFRVQVWWNGRHSLGGKRDLFRP